MLRMHFLAITLLLLCSESVHGIESESNSNATAPLIFPKDGTKYKIVKGNPSMIGSPVSQRPSVSEPALEFPKDKTKYRMAEEPLEEFPKDPTKYSTMNPSRVPLEDFPTDPSKYSTVKPQQPLNEFPKKVATTKVIKAKQAPLDEFPKDPSKYSTIRPEAVPVEEFPKDPAKYKVVQPPLEEFPKDPLMYGIKPKNPSPDFPEDPIHFRIISNKTALRILTRDDEDEDLEVLPLAKKTERPSKNPKLDSELLQPIGADVSRDAARFRNVVEVHSDAGKWLLVSLAIVASFATLIYAMTVLRKKNLTREQFRRHMLVNEDELPTEIKYSEF